MKRSLSTGLHLIGDRSIDYQSHRPLIEGYHVSREMDQNLMKEKAFPEQQPCPNCQAGLMRIEHQTYFTRIRGEMITVPDFPFWTCIICGYQEYDAQAVAWFQQLLNFHDQQLSSTEELSFGHQLYSPFPSAFLTVN